MFDGDFGGDAGGGTSQPPSFAHYFWSMLAIVVIYVIVREVWF
jgi:hypothetical protein